MMMGSVAAGAQSSPTPDSLLVGLEPGLVKVIHAHDTAQMKADRAAMEKIVADDYVIVRPRGNGDKASLIENMTHAGMKLDPFVVEKPFVLNLGTTVITGGWAELKGTDKGEAFSEKFRFSDVWTKRGGRWYLVMTQLTLADKA